MQDLTQFSKLTHELISWDFPVLSEDKENGPQAHRQEEELRTELQQHNVTAPTLNIVGTES